MKAFAGSEEKGTLDGIPSCAQFTCAKGIAINSNECFVCDVGCIRVISTQGHLFSLFILLHLSFLLVLIYFNCR